MRQADHGQLGHGRVRRQGVLDLGAVDVLAAGDDHVLLAVDHVQEALLVRADQVTGMEPAAAERLGRGLGVLPVPGHGRRAAVDDLADLAGRDVLHVVVDDPGRHDAHRLADRADLAERVRAGQRAGDRRHLGLAEHGDVVPPGTPRPSGSAASWWPGRRPRRWSSARTGHGWPATGRRTAAATVPGPGTRW